MMYAFSDSSGTTGLSLPDADVLRPDDGYVLRDDSTDPQKLDLSI